MNYKVKQKIACVADFINNLPPSKPIIVPEKGKPYTIREIRTSKEGFIYFLLEEIINEPTKHINGFGEQGFIHKGFRPLQYGSATSELVEKFKLTEETSDQPIRKLELEPVNNYINKFI